MFVYGLWTPGFEEVGTFTTWKWLTSDANHPYHVWLVPGIAARFLDYAATLMFL